VLLASYLLSAFLRSRWLTDSQLVLFTAVLLLAVRNSRFRRSSRIATSAGLLTSVVIVIIVDRTGGPVEHGIASIWAGVLLLLTIVLLVKQVLLMPEVTIQSIYGAISAYLIIGLMFAAFYTAMYWLHGMSFFAPSNEHLHSASDFQYFSFSTLTTLGYGDFTAHDSAGRAVAMIEAMTGQIFLATLVAKLVAAFRPAAASARDPAASSQGTDL
jgi:Ion channel